MGSRAEPGKSDLAYIAGFLDGDGSLMVQVKHRNGTARGWHLMFTICLYQDTRHEEPLYWIRGILGIGYISRRNDGMSELRINGVASAQRILVLLHPYIRFKKKQTEIILQITETLQEKRYFRDLSYNDRLAVADLIADLKEENYRSRSSFTREKLRAVLGFH